MSESFVRCVWGDSHGFIGSKLFDRNYKSLKAEYSISKRNKYLPDFVVYVLGEDNYKSLKEFGFRCVLVDKNPNIFDPVKRIWKHKIYLLQYALRDFDKIVYLDWDTQPLKPLPSTFWEDLSKKDAFQAPLFKYSGTKMPHREKKTRGDISQYVLPSGAFLYMSEKNIPSEILKFEECEYLKNKWLDEVYYGAWTDARYGGWQNLRFYREHFEPECCNIRRGVFQKEETKIFGHPRLKHLTGVKS